MCCDRKVEDRRAALAHWRTTLALGALHLNRFGEELRVEIKPDRRNVSRLFATEQITSTANLKVRERQLEAGAKVRRIKDRLQSLPCNLAQRILLAIEEVAPGATTASPNTATQLIELRQAELIGAVNNDRVRIWNVETRLNDGGTDKNVHLATDELPHHALELAILHLSVTHGNPCIRQQSAQLLRRRLN